MSVFWLICFVMTKPMSQKLEEKEEECVWAKRANLRFVVWGRKHAILLHILLVNYKYFVGTSSLLAYVGNSNVTTKIQMYLQISKLILHPPPPPPVYANEFNWKCGPHNRLDSEDILIHFLPPPPPPRPPYSFLHLPFSFSHFHPGPFPFSVSFPDFFFSHSSSFLTGLKSVW